MRHGHVSVVTRVVSARVVLVDHANWAPARGEGRGKVARAVPVLDVSPNNDWSQVRVWYRPAALYGNRVYNTQGFVYSRGPFHDAQPQAIESVALAQGAKTPIRHAAARNVSADKHRPTVGGLPKTIGDSVRPRPRPADLAQIGDASARHPGGG